MRRLLSASAVAAAVLFGGPADAAKGVLVLPLEHDKLPAATVGALDAAVRAEVKASLPKLELLPVPALALPDLQIAAGCADASPDCLANIGRTLGASRVVRVMTSGAANRLLVKLQIVRVRGGKSSVYEAELADVDPESGPELRWHVAQAFGRDVGPLVGRIELYTASKVGALAGAELLVDDRRVPAGALSRQPPGQHRLEVRQQGFETFIWLGVVRAGRSTRVAVKFEPKQGEPVAETPPIQDEPVPPPPPPAEATVSTQPSSPRLVFTWIFGAGAVIAASAATILAVQTESLEGEAIEQRLFCANPGDRDYESDTCRSGRSRQTGQFIAWGATGVLAVAAITAFFIEDGPALLSGEGDVAVGLAPNPDGASASLRLRF